jgi:glutathione S-transferase
LRPTTACSIDSNALAFDEAAIAVICGVPKEKFMFTLYSRPGSGSAAVEALFAELDLPFQLEDIPRGPDRRTPESYRAINPRREIPTLRMSDNSLMTESAAMMIYLADLHPEKAFAPSATSPLRADYLRWMIYFAAPVYTADLRFYYPERHTSDASQAAGVKAQAAIALEHDFQIFANWLGDRHFILGENFSAVDLYAAMLISWAPDLTALFARNHNLKKYYFRIAARPKTALVWKRNEMPVA